MGRQQSCAQFPSYFGTKYIVSRETGFSPLPFTMQDITIRFSLMFSYNESPPPWSLWGFRSSQVACFRFAVLLSPLCLGHVCLSLFLNSSW